MKLKPREYYLLMPYEFFCMCEGYNAEKRFDVEITRFAAYRIHQSLVEKPLSIERFWPMEPTEPQDEIEMTPEILEQIKKIHNIQ